MIQSIARPRRILCASRPCISSGTTTLSASASANSASSSRIKLESDCASAGGTSSTAGKPLASQCHSAGAEAIFWRAASTSTPGTTAIQCRGARQEPLRIGCASSSAARATRSRRASSSQRSSKRRRRRGRTLSRTQRRAGKSISGWSDWRTRWISSGTIKPASAIRPSGSSKAKLIDAPAPAARCRTCAAAAHPVADQAHARHATRRLPPCAWPAPRARRQSAR